MKTLLIHLCAFLVCSTGVAANTSLHPVSDTSLAKRKTVFRSGIIRYTMGTPASADTTVSTLGYSVAFDDYGTKSVQLIDRPHNGTLVLAMTDSTLYQYIWFGRVNEPTDSASAFANRSMSTVYDYRMSKNDGRQIGFLGDYLYAIRHSKERVTITRIRDTMLLGKQCKGYRLDFGDEVEYRWYWQELPMCVQHADYTVVKHKRKIETEPVTQLLATAIDINVTIPSTWFMPPKGAEDASTDIGPKFVK